MAFRHLYFNNLIRFFIVTIVAIDPGTIITGFAVLKTLNNKIFVIEIGVITNDASLHKRLHYIGLGIKSLIDKYKAKTLVMENIFVGKNVQSAFKLGQLRGICIYLAEEKNIKVSEYMATEVKKFIAGNGHSNKKTIQMILTKILNIDLTKYPLDASDALAIGYYHLFKFNKFKELHLV